MSKSDQSRRYRRDQAGPMSAKTQKRQHCISDQCDIT